MNITNLNQLNELIFFLEQWKGQQEQTGFIPTVDLLIEELKEQEQAEYDQKLAQQDKF